MKRPHRAHRRTKKIPTEISRDIWCCDQNHVHIELRKPGQAPLSLVLEPDDAYDVAAELTKAYDEAVGI